MKKRFAVTTWAVLLAILLTMAACGPAVSTEQMEQMTREAESAVPEVEITEDGDTSVPTGPGIPPVEGPTTTTDSGLQVVEIEAGDGPAPAEGDLITMNILGMLSDGTIFADTLAEGAPISAMLTETDLFSGWFEGVMLMNVGGKARLIIPPDLAFGEQGAGGVIPPNETLTMDVELLSAETPPAPTAVDEGDLTTTDSGLQYYDIVEGEGDIPVRGQEVVINYTAWLQDGAMFIASSDQVGEPLTFALGSEMGVFPGWDEGVSTMKPGGVRHLIIPPDLALGEMGGGRIPPNATLLMEVELLEVLPLVLPTEVSEADFTTTESGLKYYDIVMGDGETAEAGHSVTVDYTGWLTDNVKFDSSLDSGFPFTFVLGSGQVIEGWEEGIAGMRVGGQRQLVIPAELAYGEMGSGIIPPGATLIFEVALYDAVPQE